MQKHLFNLSSHRPAKIDPFVILLCLTPDDFTRRWRASGWERVNRNIESKTAFKSMHVAEMNKFTSLHARKKDGNFYKKISLLSI